MLGELDDSLDQVTVSMTERGAELCSARRVGGMREMFLMIHSLLLSLDS